MKLPYKPNKICCLTSCPKCGRYISESEIPELEQYELACSKDSCLKCDYNPMLGCHHHCRHPNQPTKNVKIRIGHYLRTRYQRFMKDGDESRRMTDGEKTSIIKELLE